MVSPPLIFLIAVACAESISSSATGHSRVLSAAEGTILTLAAAAPWLFGGEALGLVLALFRGLPQCVRDLRAGLRGPVTPRPWGTWADTQYRRPAFPAASFRAASDISAGPLVERGA